MGKLTARKVETAKAGKYGDGGGLQLAVASTGAKKWVLRFLWHGKAREMGLGSYPEVGLADAREKALAGRRLARSGVDPIAARKIGEGVPTFGGIADEIAGQLSEGFRNEKHKAQWRMTLTVYAEPLRAKAVDKIETADILAVLQPIWQTKPETASRVRGRIERVLNAAKAKGYRTGENPATWRGHLDNLLPKPSRLSRGHHAAMRYQDVPAFITLLREREAVAGLALEFAILTATRSGEVLGARWSEIDLAANVWTIPPERMKAAREHRVLLSERTVAILKHMETGRRRIRLSRSTCRQTALGHGDGDVVAPHGHRGRDRARVPFIVPRLGGQRNAFRARACGACPCSRHRRQGRAGLPALGRAGAAARVDGRMGSALRGRGGRERDGVQAAGIRGFTHFNSQLPGA